MARLSLMMMHTHKQLHAHLDSQSCHQGLDPTCASHHLASNHVRCRQCAADHLRGTCIHGIFDTSMPGCIAASTQELTHCSIGLPAVALCHLVPGQAADRLGRAHSACDQHRLECTRRRGGTDPSTHHWQALDDGRRSYRPHQACQQRHDLAVLCLSVSRRL